MNTNDRFSNRSRYADVIVHRLLAAGIHADATFPDLLNKRVLQQVCHNLNYRHRMAQYAARASVDLHTQVTFYSKSDLSVDRSRVHDRVCFSYSSKIYIQMKMAIYSV
jgi:exoribonuclease R